MKLIEQMKKAGVCMLRRMTGAITTPLSDLEYVIGGAWEFHVGEGSSTVYTALRRNSKGHWSVEPSKFLEKVPFYSKADNLELCDAVERLRAMQVQAKHVMQRKGIEGVRGYKFYERNDDPYSLKRVQRRLVIDRVLGLS